MTNKFVIIMPVRNVEPYIERALTSALSQDYADYRVIVTDDASTDSTLSLIESFQSPKLQVVSNPQRVGTLANLYSMAQDCDDDEIIVNLDGDDELAHKRVLSVLAVEYSNPNVWLTYGSYEYDYESRNPVPGTSARGIAQQIPQDRHDRTYFFCATHLRTYKSWLFKRIKMTDLQYNGDFYQLAEDLALMFPMIEMAGQEHAHYIDNILYLYNDRNLTSQHLSVDRDLIMEMAQHIQHQRQYPRLQNEKDFPVFS